MACTLRMASISRLATRNSTESLLLNLKVSFASTSPTFRTASICPPAEKYEVLTPSDWNLMGLPVVA